MTRCILHLVELSLLFVKLLLDLRHTLELPRLIPVVRSLGLDGPVRGLNRRIELVDSRLQSRHLILLGQDLSLPLLSGTLLRQALFSRPIVGSLAAGRRA